MTTNHVRQCYSYTFLECRQEQSLHHLPGQPVPMPHHSFWEEIFPHIQLEPPGHSLSSYHCYLGEETDPYLTTMLLQAAVESDKVSLEPPLLQTEQSQFPQLIPIRLVLQTLH